MTPSQDVLRSTGSREAAVREPLTALRVSAAARATLSKLLYPAIPTEVFATYWAFAAERQEIFFRRYAGEPGPWTGDVVLRAHRFTNAYRVTDRVSQFLISSVQYDANWSPIDLFFRTILFKFFNRIDTWQQLVAEFGEPEWERFSAEKYGRVLDARMAAGKRIYSAAYIMPSGGPKSGFKRKHRMHLNLLERMIKDGLPGKIAEERTMAGAFRLLRAYPTIGDFLAYQYVTDLNYSPLTRFEEDEFTIPGPGAREGIEKCFCDLRGKDFVWIIQQVSIVQKEAFAALGLPFRDLGGRSLQFIDCQNLFCEVAKYARVRHPEFNSASGRTRIKQRFAPVNELINFIFPPRWQLAVPHRLPQYHVAAF